MPEYSLRSSCCFLGRSCHSWTIFQISSDLRIMTGHINKDRALNYVHTTFSRGHCPGQMEYIVLIQHLQIHCVVFVRFAASKSVCIQKKPSKFCLIFKTYDEMSNTLNNVKKKWRTNWYPDILWFSIFSVLSIQYFYR